MLLTLSRCYLGGIYNKGCFETKEWTTRRGGECKETLLERSQQSQLHVPKIQGIVVIHRRLL